MRTNALPNVEGRKRQVGGFGGMQRLVPLSFHSLSSLLSFFFLEVSLFSSVTMRQSRLAVCTPWNITDSVLQCDALNGEDLNSSFVCLCYWIAKVFQ